MSLKLAIIHGPLAIIAVSEAEKWLAATGLITQP